MNQSLHPKLPGGSKKDTVIREDITRAWRLPLRDQGQRLYLSFQTIFSQTMTKCKTHSTTAEESRYLMDLSNSLISPSTWCYLALASPPQNQRETFPVFSFLSFILSTHLSKGICSLNVAISERNNPLSDTSQMMQWPKCGGSHTDLAWKCEILFWSFWVRRFFLFPKGDSGWLGCHIFFLTLKPNWGLGNSNWVVSRKLLFFKR